MENEKRNFDKEAATWDDSRRAKMAKDVADAISGEISLNRGMDVLDFGCGTGLLTLCLQPFIRSITGADSSRGMLEILERKIKDRKLSNVKTVIVDPDNGGELTGRFDLIASSMALHHVKDVPSLLDQFYRVTAPGGRLSIADLDPEEGQFHADNHQGVFHDGFAREDMRRMFAAAGYDDIKDRRATMVTKPAPGGPRSFGIFLMTGHKKGLTSHLIFRKPDDHRNPSCYAPSARMPALLIC